MKRDAITIANSKGGVGKTTSLCEICGLNPKKQILVIDLDPQGNASQFLLGLDELPDGTATTYNLLVDKNPDFNNLVLSASAKFKHVDLIPADDELSNAEDKLSRQPAWEQKLAVALKDIWEHYDHILIDTGPQINMLTYIALMTSRTLIIPTDASKKAFRGINKLMYMRDSLKERTGHYIEKVHVIQTATHKEQSISFKKSRSALQESFPKNFRNEILLPHSVKVQDADWSKEPIMACDILPKNHKLVTGYKKLSKLALEVR